VSKIVNDDADKRDTIGLKTTGVACAQKIACATPRKLNMITLSEFFFLQCGVMQNSSLPTDVTRRDDVIRRSNEVEFFRVIAQRFNICLMRFIGDLVGQVKSAQTSCRW